MRPRMNMITLGAVDLARSIAFYQDGLGFPQEGEGDDVAFFACTERGSARRTSRRSNTGNQG